MSEAHPEQRVTCDEWSGRSSIGGRLPSCCLIGHRPFEVKGEEELLQIATSIEGHPDNVPALGLVNERPFCPGYWHLPNCIEETTGSKVFG